MEELVQKLKEFYKLLHDKIMDGSIGIQMQLSPSMGYFAEVTVPIKDHKFKFSISSTFVCTHGFDSLASPNDLFSELFTIEDIRELRKRFNGDPMTPQQRKLKIIELESKLKQLKQDEDESNQV